MPRQMYGLGSFVKKAVKGVTKGVKKIVKSPIGKAAALYFAPMAFGQPAGVTGYKDLFGRGKFGGIPDLIQSGVDKLGLGVAKNDKPTFGQVAKVFGIGSLGGAALEALTASGASEEELKNIRDVDALKSYLRKGYEQLNTDAGPMQGDRFVEGQTYE